ncbi:Rrf2 family transcriptional regulator [Anoxybacter fermentans]|uniref:Rrf2 family transcriptional regulator n=1 Tax=Anoxybacter fermentans TaxID=1323375 RepID=A0A3S9SXL5_9FIRM|nr:Rrf2 family transcriptional regulator [Anoxybacter fermentans]AZR73083.1 Rrf2 family transcriptional regulator [Anoxybacter fermentans]
MKLSTKGRYGVRAMFELAMRYGAGPVSLRSIAERQGLSEHYLEQLIAVLRKAGLVKSVRGAYGGYLLAQEPKDITIGDIIRTLEGPVAPVECVGDEEYECEKVEVCVTRIIWEKLKEKIDEVLDEMTLEDLCQYALEKKHEKDEGFMYHI